MEEVKTVSFSVKSSWIALEKEVMDAFFVEDYIEGAKDSDPSDFINLQSCVQLSRSHGLDEALCIKIEMNGKELIRKVHIVCEAPIVESYGMFEEYLKTIKGEKLEEHDGTVVFLIPIEGLRTKELLLKFVGMKGASSMWLLGVWLYVAVGEIGSRLEELLADTNLSEKAQQFRCLAAARAAMQPPQPISSREDSVAELRHYIDLSIQKMEQRVVDNVQQQVRELEERQNERLDSIIHLLSSLPTSRN